MESYCKGEIFEVYRPAVQKLELIIGELAAFEHEAHEHGEIEKHLEKRGMEVMRQRFQGYINRLSGTQEQQGQILGSDGVPRRQVRFRKHYLISVFELLEVWRLSYSGRDLGRVFPLDAQLNLPPPRYSRGMGERIGEVVAQGSYEAAVEHIA